MALQKEYLYDNGVTVNYWNIDYINIKKDEELVEVGMNCYLSKEIRNKDNSEPYKKNVFYIDNETNKFNEYFSLEKFSTSQENIYELAYKYLKENEVFFQYAEDILEEEI